ncbi:MAG: histidine phosphatase family protein [Pseudomonadota bacterium]
MAEAFLVGMRHGETLYNVLSLMSGPREVSLTSVGEGQSRAAGPLLDGVCRFDVVFCSDKIRARNTAILALASAKNSPILTPEPSPDSITGRIRRSSILTENAGTTHAPGGESEKQVVDRVKKFLDIEVLPCLKRGDIHARFFLPSTDFRAGRGARCLRGDLPA